MDRTFKSCLVSYIKEWRDKGWGNGVWQCSTLYLVNNLRHCRLISPNNNTSQKEVNDRNRKQSSFLSLERCGLGNEYKHHDPTSNTLMVGKLIVLMLSHQACWVNKLISFSFAEHERQNVIIIHCTTDDHAPNFNRTRAPMNAKWKFAVSREKCGTPLLLIVKVGKSGNEILDW